MPGRSGGRRWFFTFVAFSGEIGNWWRTVERYGASVAGPLQEVTGFFS